MAKRILSIFLALCIVLALLSGMAWVAGVEAKERNQSGRGKPAFGIFGDSAQWIFSDDGTLAIGGLGATKKYKLVYENDGRIYPNNPWTDGFWSGLRRKIKTIDIKRGITAIGDYGFCDCYLAETVAITSNVTRIGECSFLFCDSLRDVYYTGSKAQWEKIDIAEGNENLTNAAIHYNSDNSTSDALTARCRDSAASAGSQVWEAIQRVVRSIDSKCRWLLYSFGRL